MKINRNRNKFTKILVIVILLLIVPLLSLYPFFKNLNQAENTFKNFMSSYTSQDINKANTFIHNFNLPNINEVFEKSIHQSTNDTQTKILKQLKDLVFSIKYEILSCKTLINKSTLNVKFTYQDISRYIKTFFTKTTLNPDNIEENYKNLLDYLKSDKYKVSNEIKVELIKNDNSWDIVMCDKLLNILTSGIYKNFLLQKENSTKS